MTSLLQDEQDKYYMALAIKEAKKALIIDEVPIGCVIVNDDKVIARGYNKRETNNDPLGHAELIAIKKASRKLDSWRLNNVTLYVTLEPCTMCMGAIVNSRIKRVVFAARDPKAGAVKSLYNIGIDNLLNHKVKVTEGVLQEDCAILLKDFFKKLRRKNSKASKKNT